jgi:PAS domain S-box-containing protein
MSRANIETRDWNESPSALMASLQDNPIMFQLLFERCADAILLFDPQLGMFVDCNAAAVALLRADSKEKLLSSRPDEMSPYLQPDGTPSREKSDEVTALVEKHGGYRFEWLARRFDGEEVPLEVLCTPITASGRRLNVVIPRDISERKKAERELLELNQSLERRVEERTTELTTSEARFRALVEHAPEAIVLFDGDTGHFLFGNQHACTLYGVPMEKLAELTPADVSPEFQTNGRRTSEMAREKMDEALAGGTPVFEWTHRRPDGTLVPTEVRLLRLPAEGRNLVRASIIDNTESKRAQRALSESEEKFRALFEGTSNGVVLMDEDKLLEVNPAAVRILGRMSAHELVGRHPSAFSPALQPNGGSSEIMAGQYIEECLTKGHVRLEWLCTSPEGNEIPLEVVLTRIEWSGRKVIQAFITDISERKKAEAELRASEARLRDANHELHHEIEQRRRAEELINHRVRMSTLTAEVSLALNSDAECQPMLQRCCELVVRHLDVAFARVWTLNESTQTLELQASAGCYTHLDGPHSRVPVGQLKIGLIARDKKPLLINTVQSDRWVSDPAWAKREGMVAFAGYPLLIENRLLGVLGMFARNPLAEDILKTLGSIADSFALGVERKRSQIALAESEARFSAAFHASPILTMIFRSSDAKLVLVNDAFLNWAGYSRDEVLGRTGGDLQLWEDPTERERYWKDVRLGSSIRGRECRVRSRHGRISTMLISGVTIELNGMDHLLVMGVDISERKQAEVELLRTLERETELNQLKSNFVSMVSHEFRTPLGIIQSSAELLREFYQKMPPGDRDQQLDSITRNTRRMATLMEEMLVLSRLDAGKLEFQPTALDLGRFCRRLVDEVLSATNRQCPIELTLASAALDAHADERLLSHIFTNLLSNAVKYSEPGSTVSFTVERDGAHVLCIVRDHGIGISAQDQQHLFKAFHRGSNVGTRPGTGLGLLLVKRCVGLHHGTVQLTSRPEEGTTVTVRLPVFGKPS